jgi:hypothetical protein
MHRTASKNRSDKTQDRSIVNNPPKLVANQCNKNTKLNGTTTSVAPSTSNIDIEWEANIHEKITEPVISMIRPNAAESLPNYDDFPEPDTCIRRIRFPSEVKNDEKPKNGSSFAERFFIFSIGAVFGMVLTVCAAFMDDSYSVNYTEESTAPVVQESNHQPPLPGTFAQLPVTKASITQAQAKANTPENRTQFSIEEKAPVNSSITNSNTAIATPPPAAKKISETTLLVPVKSTSELPRNNTKKLKTRIRSQPKLTQDASDNPYL